MSKKNKEILLATLDTETRGMFGKIFKLGFYSKLGYIHKYSFTELLPSLEEYKEEYDIHVYIHNADFDTAKIIKDIVQAGYKIDFAQSIFINNQLVSMHVSSLFTIHDSYHILKDSLDNLCKSFDLSADYAKYNLTQHILECGYAIFDDDTEMYNDKKSKGNYFELVSPDEDILNYYLKLDCISLYKLVEQTIQVSGIPIEKFIRCPTTPSLTVQVYKNQFPNEYELATSFPRKYFGEMGELVESIVRASYYGGRVEVITPVCEKGYHFDVNSLFAHEQESNKFPVGAYNYYTGKQASTCWNYFRKTHNGGGCIHCVVDVPYMKIPPLPYKAFGKLLFPYGHLEGVWTFPELEMSLKYGVKILEIKQVVYFKRMEDIFSGYVGKYKEIKVNSTGAKRQHAKDCLTNFYGKFGMKRVRTTFDNVEKELELKEKGVPFVIHNYCKDGINLEFIEKAFTSRADYIQPQIASYVTSYSRMHLYEEGLIPQYEKGVVYYCDTDSVACEKEMDDYYVHPTEFGKWKKESDIEKALFLQPKMYCEEMSWHEKGLTTNAKGKGIPRDFLQKLKMKDYENYFNVLASQSQERLHIVDGKPNRMKLISALKANKDVETQLIRDKSLNVLAVQKRIIDYANNTSEPHYIDSRNINNTVYAKELEKFNKAIMDYDFDNDMLFDMTKSFGKIKTPDETSPIWNEYVELTQNQKRIYFSEYGGDVYQWCEKVGIEIADLKLIM